MTITFKNIDATPGAANAAVSVMDPLDLTRIDYLRENQGRTQTSTFALSSAEGSDQTLVYVRRDYNPNEDKSRVSIRLQTLVVDDTLDEPEVGLYESGIFWNHPGRYEIDADQVMAMLGSVFSLACVSFDAGDGSPDTALINRLNFGSTEAPWG